MKNNYSRGFSLIELIVTMLIISIVFATGAILVTSSTTNYFEQKKLDSGQSIVNININRFSNYINPIFKNLYQPLYSSTSGNQVIFAIANVDDFQALDLDSTYMSQLIKISLVGSNIVMESYSPINNGGTDILYSNDSTNFDDLTTNILVATSTTIAKNINSLGITYLDIDGIATSTSSEISFVSIELSITSSNVTRERTLFISPWRLLL